VVDIVNNIFRLKSLIEKYPGAKWDQKVRAFAEDNKRTRATVYLWLTKGAPDYMLDSAELRLSRQ